MRPDHAGPPRRSVLLLGVGAGAVALSGCTLNNPYSSDKTPAAEAVRDLAPDVAIAVEAVALISAAQRELEALAPGDAARLSGLSSAYATYVDALRGAVPKGVDVSGSATPTPLPSTPAATGADAGRTAALRTARSIHDQLTGFALGAESGAFARLLGSMSAGLSQQLKVAAR